MLEHCKRHFKGLLEDRRQYPGCVGAAQEMRPFVMDNRYRQPPIVTYVVWRRVGPVGLVDSLLCVLLAT